MTISGDTVGEVETLKYLLGSFVQKKVVLMRMWNRIEWRKTSGDKPPYTLMGILNVIQT